MVRWLVVLFVGASFISYSQKILLVNSGEVMKTASVLYDSGKYEEAIKELLTISERDSSYVVSRIEVIRSFRANKNYDKAIELSNVLLQKSTTYRNQLLVLRALVTKDNGEFEKAVALHEEALKEFPTDVILTHNLGLTYYVNKSYEKSAEYFFKALTINPFHSPSHLMLARMAIRQGRKVNGMLSMGMYLGINPKDNKELVVLNSFLGNELKEEGEIPSVGPNATEKLDQIIRAKIAMEKSFTSKVSIDVPVVKQFELLFDQLNTITGTNDPWIGYYLPIYKAIKDQQAAETFIYHILTSTSLEAAAKWRTKNDKQLQSFYQIANVELTKKRERLSVPSLGFAGPVKAYFRTNNSVEALGQKNGEVRTGHWIFFHDNNEKQSEGIYDAKGIKQGVWTYYYDNSKVKSVENIEIGEATGYSREGFKLEHFFLKDDKIHGDVETYYPCGSVKEKMKYQDGLRHGPLEGFFPSGALQRRQTYEKGKINGESVFYFEDGGIESKIYYKEGVASGKYISYYSNRVIKEQGQYTNDEVSGKWSTYFANGKLRRTGLYSATGAGIGEWVYYNERGELIEKRNFDATGNWSGENILYEDGKVTTVVTFKSNLLMKTASYLPDGKIIATYGNKEGNFLNKYYFSTGQLKSEGSYKKGEKDGEWKQYDRFGNLIGIYNYAQGKLTGTGQDKYASGQLQEEKVFAEDELNGYVKEYYQNTNVKREGWFVNGKREQQWLSYYPDGTVESDHYYFNNEIEHATDYAPDGKKSDITTYEEGKISDMTAYTMEGKVSPVRKADGSKITYEDMYSNGKLRIRYYTLCGDYEGDFIRMYPDGTVFIKYKIKNGQRQGPYERRALTGTILTQGQYQESEEEGLWKYYHDNGELSSEGRYVQGKRDSIWNFYSLAGKISSTGNYFQGERHGVSRYFSPEGRPLLEKMYNGGEILAYRPVDEKGTVGEWISFSGNEKIQINYQDGKPAWREEYLRGKREGHHQIFFQNGNVYSDYGYRKGDYQGDYKIFFPNGKVMEQGSYKDDDVNGAKEFFNEDGTPFLLETYKYGVLQGKSILYNKGVPQKELMFWNGMVEQ